MAIGLTASLCGIVTGPSFARAEDDAGPRFFENKIRPLLVKHCHECHGPEKQESGLRLDLHEPALRGGDRGVAWKPHAPDESLLLQVVRHEDDDLQMPPEKKLAEDEIVYLTKWISAGAPWPRDVTPQAESENSSGQIDTRGIPERIAMARDELWSLGPIANPALPAINDPAVRDEIDQFIAARLQPAGLTLSPSADRATLARRIYFDLVGLPPTYEESQQFIADESPDAVAKLIDKLLASKQYGERWGRHWLDVARYADTVGYNFQRDRRYPFSYTYRDYVIRAFNQDKPFNRFLQEQLAADQLDLAASDPDLAALGFLTVGRRFRQRTHEIIDDRIDVTTRGMMGLTVSCARCHDHKFDPIGAADYYALHGVFASSHEPDILPLIGAPPTGSGYQEFKQELNKRNATGESYLTKLRADIQREASSRIGDYLRNIAQARIDGTPDKVKPAAPRGALRPEIVKRWQAFLNGQSSRQVAAFDSWHRVRDLPTDNWPQVATERLQAYQKEGGDAELVGALLQPTPANNLAEFSLRLGSYLESAYTESGSEEAKAKLSEARRTAADWVRGTESPSNMSGVNIEKVWAQQERDHYHGLKKKVAELIADSPHSPPRAMVLKDKPRPTNPVVFLRGAPERRGPAVPRRFLEVLRPVVGRDMFPADRSGRLELARAITHPDNPLTARVIVNRVWLHHFGIGLVATPNDFGVNGARPTHPDLLDYLARWFMEQGWSIKQLHRKIMLSAVYQQSVRSNEHAAKIDQANRLLWRQNSRRLELEPLRDALLLVSGNLDRTSGGKPIDLEKQPFSYRRTVYGFVDREALGKLFSTFDLPNPDTSVGRRAETNVPQQTLFLVNHPFVLQQAQAVAARPEVREAATRADKVVAVYRCVLARHPTADETTLAMQYLEQEFAAVEGEEKKSFAPLPRLAHVLIMSNEFSFVD